MKIKLFLLIIFTYHNVYAQIELKYKYKLNNLPKWVQEMYKDNSNPGSVIKLYEKYHKKNEFTKNKHTQYYKRWLRNMSRNSPDANTNFYSNSLNQWQCIGPWDFDKDAASRSYAPGAAHIYTIEQSANNSDVLYAGTATAGAWKTLDKGQNWHLITKNLQISRVYALEIDFINHNTVYISGDNKLYKSFDSGTNWIIIGDSVFNSVSHSIKDIKLKPSNNQEIFIASDQGLYSSVDAGNNFTKIFDGSFLEIEFHPNSSDTIYFVMQSGDSTLFYRSSNGGTSLSNFTNGWPSPSIGDEQKRTEIAVSPAEPDKIVALATGAANGGSGLYGIYISYDKGENWNFQCCGNQPAGVPDSTNINMMGWQPDGSDDGGQYYYDLALAINPIDANIIHVGGVNHWISFDNGITFNCPAKWSQPHKKGYVHADIHDINYYGDDLWFACDGGVFYSNNKGDSIYKKMYGIAGTDFWGFGVGFKDINVMLGGTYHNGTLLKDNSTYNNDWISTQGGDNYRGFVNFGNPRKVYHDGGGKVLSGNRNVELSSFPLDKKPNASYTIGASSQLEFDPRCYNIIYSGKDSILWLSKNGGKNFEDIYHFDAKVTSIEVAWSNPDVIYVATWPGWWEEKKLYRSDNGGKNWSEITIPSSLLDGYLSRPYDITVSSNNENIIWVVRCPQSGNYNANDGYKVFKSLDGGQNWINLTTPILDGQYMTNIEHQRGSNGGVYLGTRTSVFYRNDNMTDWEIYNNNLPKKTLSTQLYPHYGEGKLVNGTNRSVYTIDLYNDSPPSAQIAADKLEINCLNDTVKFVDHSALRKNSATWQWSFPGGNPSSSNLENPTVIYSSPGKYDVSLTVTDSFGSSTQNINDLITYTDSVFNINNSTIYSESFDLDMFPPQAWYMPDNSPFFWEQIDIDTGVNCTPNQVIYVNHYWIDKRGEEAYLITNKIHLGDGNNAINWLTYDYAYSGYSSNNNDGFRIDVSTDCGNTWDSIYGAIGSNLQTTSYSNSAWDPTCGSWDSDSINLSNIGLNGDTIMIRFVAINDYGNRFFMDNININGKNILSIENLNTNKSQFNISIFPNPSSENIKITSNQNKFELSLYSVVGKLVKTQTINNGKADINISNLEKGIYILKVNMNGTIQQKKIIIN